MTTIGAYEAKTHLPKLLDRVAEGEQITITRNGKPVARLVPVGEEAPMAVETAIQHLKEIRKGCRLDGISIRELIEEGRRY